jgi:hypothetical protein
MDEAIKKYFESGPPETTRIQLERLCADIALSFVNAHEPAVLVPREDHAYGLPRLPEDKQ